MPKAKGLILLLPTHLPSKTAERDRGKVGDKYSEGLDYTSRWLTVSTTVYIRLLQRRSCKQAEGTFYQPAKFKKKHFCSSWDPQKIQGGFPPVTLLHALPQANVG